MDFRRLILLVAVLYACNANDGDANQTEPEPLPSDLLAACPDSARFERSGSGQCTEIGCQNGYALDVSPSSGWAPGGYRFELSIDGRLVTCQGSLPLKACSEPSFSCDAEGVRLGESGCALPANQQGIASVTFQGYPLALSIRVVRDDVELARAALTPEYKAGQPNGPGCDPICCSASGELTVAASL